MSNPIIRLPAIAQQAAAIALTPTIPRKKKDCDNPWSASDFEEQRSHLTMFVRENLLRHLDADEIRRVLIQAPVKSGKREIAEYIAKRDEHLRVNRVHAYLTSWHRVADTEQRDELKVHNLDVFSIKDDASVALCIDWIRRQIRAGKKVVLHLDECDFGSGERQKLAQVYKEYRIHEDVKFLLYSATPQEVLFSSEIDEDTDGEYREMLDEIERAGVFIKYNPPFGYCGPGRFLDDNLVFNACPFFYTNPDGTIRLSPQGAKIIADLRASIRDNSRRNCIKLRLSASDRTGRTGNRKQNKHIYQFLQHAHSCPELDGVHIVVDKLEKDVPKNTRVLTEQIKWSRKDYWDLKATGVPIVLVVDQTASRSTELVCHDRLYATHDFRHKYVFTTVSQAQERVNHYLQNYGNEFQPIRIYGHKPTFALSAGRITYAQYMLKDWKKQKIDRRIIARLGLTGELYYIKSVSTNTIHPNHTQPLSSDEADRVLQDLGSYSEPAISPRVRGDAGQEPVIACQFIECNMNNFESKRPQIIRLAGTRNYRNPFVNSVAQGIEEGYKGYLRGVWRILQYNDIYMNERKWGVTTDEPRLTICYNDGRLGIALKWHTGQFENINTLQTFKSMYQE